MVALTYTSHNPPVVSIKMDTITLMIYCFAAYTIDPFVQNWDGWGGGYICDVHIPLNRIKNDVSLKYTHCNKFESNSY